MSELRSENNLNPLVSIVVITFNSSMYVLETLESAGCQTYKNLELIVSDDGSTDDTVEKCNAWIEKKKDRFVRAKVLTADCNTGIPANCNRAIRECKGKWIKTIAGDDILLPECITINMEYIISSSEDISILFSTVFSFSVKEGKYVIDEINKNERLQHFSTLCAKQQFEVLLTSNIISAPSGFYTRELLLEYPYNELYRNMEDYPEWLKLTYHGVKLFFMDKPTVMYRCDNSSATRYAPHYYPLQMHETKVLFFWTEKIKYLGKEHKAIYNRERQELFLYDLVDLFLKNRKSRWHSFIYRMMKWMVFHFCFFNSNNLKR